MMFLAPNPNPMFRAITSSTTTLRPSPLPKTPQLSIPASTQKSKMASEPRKDKNQFWLLKTEPGEWSWSDQSTNKGVTTWDGVKNRQAQNNLKSMRLSDLCFFYHSGAKHRRVVGVVEVVREWDDGDEAVEVRAVGEMRRPVDLKEMKDDVGLKGFALLRQPRLSVVPVPGDVWERVCEMGGGFDGDGQEELGADGDGDGD